MITIFLLSFILFGNVIGSEIDNTFDYRLLSTDIKKVQKAINEGANVNAVARNGSGNTALIMAAKNNNIEVAKLLIEKGAYLDVKNEDDNTALMSASRRGCFEIVKLLIEAGAKFNIQNNFGYTALMLAAANNRQEISKLLIHAGADLDLKDEDGSTALMLAESKKFEEIIKLIKERMEYLAKIKKEVSSCLSDPNAQLLPIVVSNLINEYL